MSDSPGCSEPNKAELWGWWHSHQKWFDHLHKKAAHKALDIEDDAMIVSNRGIGSAGVLGVAAVSVLGPLLGAAAMLALQSREPSEPTETPAAASPADADYEVRFYDAAGNEVQLDRWTGKPTTPTPAE